jgi:predicted AlkP superfamily phosphohydrolase/phosphomutase
MIGLDAADKDLLLEWCDQGRLPNLRRMRDEGCWGVVKSPPGFGSGAVWPSLYTGVSPARHGRYFYRQVRAGDYEASRFEDTDFRARPLWEILGDAGRRVAVFDVPKAGLSQNVNGIQVVDWLVHGPVYHEIRTSPPAVAEELARTYGEDPLPRCDQPGMRTPDEHKVLRDIFLMRVRKKADAAIDYLEREPWDFFLTVFGDSHCVGHQCWHLRDPGHPRHDAAAAERIGDPVFDVYAEIDASIGRIVEHVDDDVTVMVVSATGFGPNYTGNYVLDEILRRLEGRRKTRGLDWFVRAKQRAKAVLPSQVRGRWRKTSRRLEERIAHTDREQRSFFTVPHNDIAGAVRVNLVGREPGGRVRPEDVEGVFSKLRRDLLEVRNLATGQTIVEDVVRVSDFCKGEQIGEMPDFFVLWKRDAPIERVGSPRIGEIVYRQRGNRTGDHTADSVFFARGPGIVPGEIAPPSIMDFVPTIAALEDVHLEETDGRTITELCGATSGSGSPPTP